MQHLPRGTISFLFTDIDSSTRLWHEHPDAMRSAYDRHDTILRDAIAANEGVVYKTVGDAFQAAFPTAKDAATAALESQRALQAECWPMPEPLRVRMALHTGAVDPDAGGDYRSPVLNRLGRLLDVAHGDQVLVSQATMELARDHLPEGTSFVDLGEQRLKDLYRPERIWQIAHPALRVDFPPLRTLDSHPNNLPTQLTPFIGREDDVLSVTALIGRDDVRLVTLTGPGGIGKTRLSLQAAADLIDGFEHGVFFTELDAISDPDLVPAAIGQTLGLRDTGEEPMVTTLTAYLRDRRLLLVLDNLEQVVAAATLVGNLLSAAPGLKVVATSRVRLQIQGEHEYPVRPFFLPDPERAQDIGAMSQYESVRLFIERAEAAKPTFQITRENAPAVAEICTRLDGLPLAIELAASRIKVLPPEAMLNRLTARLPILTGGARNLPARQQTLRGAIAWSYELLSPEDKALFRRIAVFSGGATLEAMEAVAADDGQTLDALDVLDGIGRLVDHSLVRQGEEAGEPRFAMFETIREFGLERLEEHGETHEAGCRHGAWVDSFISRYRLEMSSAQSSAWLDQVDIEQDNVRTAVTWAFEHDPALAVRIVSYAVRFWLWRCHFREGHVWLERALALEHKDIAIEDRARALLTSFAFRSTAIDMSVHLERVKQANALYTQAGTKIDAAFACSVLGLVTIEMYGYDAARDVLVEAVRIAREAGDPVVLAACLNNAGINALDAGFIEPARIALNEAYEIIRDRSGISRATMFSSYGDLVRADGDVPRAIAIYTQSLRDSWAGRLSGLILTNLMSLSITMVAMGEWVRAARLMGAVAAYGRQGDNALDPELGGSAQSEYEQSATTAMQHLGEPAFRQAWAEGAATPIEEIVSELLAVEPVPHG